MKRISYLSLLIVLTSFTNQTSFTAGLHNDAIEVLKKTSAKLNGSENISYSYFRSINYFSENIHSEAAAKAFFDFDKSNTLLGFKFQIENGQSKIVYNGTERFFLSKKDKTIKITYTPQRNDFESNSFFENSIITLKNSLPSIISDKEIDKALTDTTIGERKYHLISLTVKNRTLTGLGDFFPISLKRNFLYKIVIDKRNHLPLQMIQTNDVEPEDYVLTAFNDIKINDENPPEFSWYYSTYGDYEPTADKKLELIKENSIAPVWELPHYSDETPLKSTQLKDKYVLLEFWIKNCGYCIEAVPKLNRIVEKYSNKNFQIIGINARDPKHDIDEFYERNKPLFKTVSDENGKVTTDFGIDAFPKVVLIDKESNVIYTGGINIEKLEEILDAIL